MFNGITNLKREAIAFLNKRADVVYMLINTFENKAYVKYTGGIAIQVECSENLDQRRYVNQLVQDFGIKSDPIISHNFNTASYDDGYNKRVDFEL